MRRSPLKANDKSRSISKSRLVESNVSQRNTSSVYYCHYKNAMYMGGIKAFKKEGRGILLHDCGLSVITSYFNDLMHGHNIFFDNYSLLSAIFSKHKVAEAVYRTQGFLAYLIYNADRQLEGRCKLINFVSKTVTYATFKKGNMLDKMEEGDDQILARIFEDGELQLLIGRTHAKVLSYQFDKIPSIECQKQGNKVMIGFQKNGFMNGLGFQFVFRASHGGYNPDTHRQEDEFELKIMERGYYMNTQLNGMGEKVFKNGNFYIGEFKNGVFEGNGILKNTIKKNWVSGYFKDGNLVELLQYNSEGATKQIDRIVEALHQRKTNWINNEVPLQDLSFFIDQIEKIITMTPNKQVQTLEQRKLEVLKRIQQKFITDNPDDDTDHSLDQLSNHMAQNPNHNRQSRNYVHSFGQKGENSKASEYRQDSKQMGSSRGVQPRTHSPLRKDNKNNSVSPHKKVNLTHSPLRHNDQPSWTKTNEQLFSSRKTDSQPSSNVWNLPRNQIQQSRGHEDTRDRAPRSTQVQEGLSSGRQSLGSGSGLDSKRLMAKNKIFKYLESQEERNSPQFTYTKIDTLRGLERRY